MKIILASDRAGAELRDRLAVYLSEEGYTVENVTDPALQIDYPDAADYLCIRVANGQFDRGILVCGSGIGMSIAANKHRGIRAGVAADEYSARMATIHNNANVLCLGARTTGFEKAFGLADAFLTAEFSAGERHLRRLDKIAKLEQESLK